VLTQDESLALGGERREARRGAALGQRAGDQQAAAAHAVARRCGWSADTGQTPTSRCATCRDPATQPLGAEVRATDERRHEHDQRQDPKHHVLRAGGDKQTGEGEQRYGEDARKRAQAHARSLPEGVTERRYRRGGRSISLSAVLTTRYLAAALLVLGFAGAPAAQAATSTAPTTTLTGAGNTITSENPLNDLGSSANYRSLITGISPNPPGLSLQILQFSDRLQITNHTGQTITIYGYSGEPYARILPDGTVQQNVRSPAVYLNENFYANVTVPPSANPNAPPRWSVVDRTGTFQWHDHRIHWMSPVTPPQVKDTSKRTKIFDWRVPIAVGKRTGAISGTLFWTPQSSSFPIGALIALIAIVLASGALVLVVRRRRGLGPPGPGEDGDHSTGGGGGGDDRAPVATPARPAREAW
jgi:hypothetical protein